jgi:hypothetical protein
MNSGSFVLDNAKAPMWAIQQIRNCRAGDHFFIITYNAASGACEKGKQWQQAYTTSGSFSFVSRPKPLGSLTESRLTTCFRHLNK